MNYTYSFLFCVFPPGRDLSMEFRPRVCTFVYMCVNVCVEEGRARRSHSAGEVAGKSARPRSRLSSCSSSLHFSDCLSFYLIFIRFLYNIYLLKMFLWFKALLCLSLFYKKQSIPWSSSRPSPHHFHYQHHQLSTTNLSPFFSKFLHVTGL